MSQARIFAPIQVVDVRQGQYGAFAMLRQEVSLPSSGSSFNNTVGLSHLLKASTLKPQVRTFLLTVAEGTTKEDVQAALDAMPQAKLYRILSCYPTIDPSQQRRITEGQTTIGEIAERQLISNAEGEVVMFKAADGSEYRQYGVNFLDTTGERPDVDSRQENVDNGEIYVAEEAAPAIALAGDSTAVGALPKEAVAA